MSDSSTKKEFSFFSSKFSFSVSPFLKKKYKSKKKSKDMEETERIMIKTWKTMYPDEENYQLWYLSLSRRERMEWKKRFETTRDDAKEENEIIKGCRERRRTSLLKFEALSHPPKLSSTNRIRTKQNLEQEVRKSKIGSFALFLERRYRYYKDTRGEIEGIQSPQDVRVLCLTIIFVRKKKLLNIYRYA